MEQNNFDNKEKHERIKQILEKPAQERNENEL